ncbi:MAG: 50S ribosomal protein L5 [Brevinematia bacterium]
MAEETVKKKTTKKKEAEKQVVELKKDYVPRLKIHYLENVVKELKKQYKFSSVMAVPRIVKVVLNMGVGEATQDKSLLDPAVDELTLIAGQKAVKTYAKVAISNFHLRKGMPIGARVTLRGNRMYDFLDKLISIALPRVRDFKGLNPSSFDGRGNYTFGLKEQLVFPEIDYDKIKKIRGLDITIVTTARNDEEAYQLLKMMGFPFREK